MSPQIPKESQAWVPFSKGFRPFFLSAACLAAVAIVYWTLLFSGQVPATSLAYFPALTWHMHEMVYGYVGAVIAGFLLTAVNNWTGRTTLEGWPLAMLLLIWLGARILPFLGDGYGWYVAFCNAAFFVYLAISIALPIVASGNYRNLFVVVIVSILAISNILLHADLLGVGDAQIAVLAIPIAFYLQLLLIIIIAGRVFPMFSANGLNGIYSPKKWLWLEIASVISFASFAVLDITFRYGATVSNHLVFAAALAVAIIHSARVAAWFHWRIATKPLIWVLHVGYYFLIIGVVLVGLSAYYSQMRVPGLHAILVGGVGLITVGMMARVSLGHTARDLNNPTKLITAVFVLILLAAVVRVFLPLASPDFYLTAIRLAGYLWGAAFLLFVSYFSIVLLSPRIDGVRG